MKTALPLIAFLLLSACSTSSYRAVQEIDFERLVDQGCTRAGDRFSVTARVNCTTHETIVLWNGYDGSLTAAVSLPPDSVGSKMRGVFGKGRYEPGYDRLNPLRVNNTPLTVTMRCEAARMSPAADRFSNFDAGQRVEFGF